MLCAHRIINNMLISYLDTMNFHEKSSNLQIKMLSISAKVINTNADLLSLFNFE
jgi:hypothetical protein